VTTSSTDPTVARRAFDVVVLAGARSERVGGADKALIEVGGVTLIDRVLAGLDRARRVVVVGPHRPVSRAVHWCQEEPAGGGPVAAFSAGLHPLQPDPAPHVLLLAADLPFIAAAVPALLATLTCNVDVAVLVDSSGRANYLASAWQRASIDARLAELDHPAGLPMRLLFTGLSAAPVLDEDGWGTDCDTWEAIELARLRIARTGG
jgi:molybdopterin-guanine dinucleotide biosynthesis protein A